MSGLGSSDHGMVEYKILKTAGQIGSQLLISEQQMGLFKVLLGRNPWNEVMERREV